MCGIAGINPFYMFTYNKDPYFYAFFCYIRVEPRYYYNLQKRLNKEKKTDGNRGSFLAMDCSYIFKPFVSHNINFDTGILMLAPCWGLRRIWWNHFLFEFHTGLALVFHEHKVGFGGTLGVRLGYKFQA